MSQKAALYCRVSTQEQGDNKTVERQLYELREYCKRNDFEVVKEYKDVISGTIMKRNELEQLKEDAKNKAFDVVLISEVSRISRGQDAIVDVILFEREMEKHGIRVHFLDGSSDNEIVKSVRAIIAKTERADFIKRSTNGRYARAKRGSAMGGKTQYGYRYISKMTNGFRGGVWEIHEEEAKNLNLILDLYLSLQSQKKVLRELANKGIKARNGKNWRSSSLRHLFENEACVTGLIHYKDIPINVPKIIDKKKWDVVQQLLKERAKKHFKEKASKYLLGGLVRCSICGSPYSGELCKGVRYYRCNNRHNTFPNPRTCNAKMILADKLEGKVWESVSYLMSHPDILQQRIDYLNSDNIQLEKALTEEKKSLTDKLEAISKKKEKLVDLYSEEGLSKEVLLSKIGDFSKEEEILKDELASVENKLTQLNRIPVFIKSLEEFCSRARIQLKLLTFEEKQWFLRLIIKKINFGYFENSIDIVGEIPLTDEDKPMDIKLNTKQRALVGIENHSLLNNISLSQILQFKLQVFI